MRVWLLSLFCTAAMAQGQRPLLAVNEFAAQGAPGALVAAAQQDVVYGLRQLDVFQVLSADDVRQLLALERTRQLLGQNEKDEASLSLLNSALGARYVVTGSLAQEGSTTRVELRLLDTADGKVLSQKALASDKGAEGLAHDLPALAQQLVGPLLASQQGELFVRASEEAAEVLVDDALLGTTPMHSALKLSRGRHKLQVRKDGFIAQTQEVRIEPGQQTAAEVRLEPSADYAEAWRLRHGRLRVGAYISTAVAVGALTGGYFLQRGLLRTYDDEFVPRQYALADLPPPSSVQENPARLSVYEGCTGDGKSVCAARATALKGQLSTQQLLVGGLWGLGAVATGTAAYLWITGQDPNRYGKAVAALVPGPRPTLVLALPW